MEIFIDLLFHITVLILVLTLLFGVFSSDISLNYYFSNHLDEFDILSLYYNVNRYGNRVYFCSAKHIYTGDYYDYQISFDDYIKLGGVI